MFISAHLSNSMYACVVLPVSGFCSACQQIAFKTFGKLYQMAAQTLKTLKDYFWKLLGKTPASYTSQLIHSCQQQPALFEERLPLEVFNQWMVPYLSAKQLHNLALVNKSHLPLLRQPDTLDKLSSDPQVNSFKLLLALGSFMQKIKVKKNWPDAEFRSSLPQLINLTDVNLSEGQRIKEETIRALIQNCPKLTAMNLSCCRQVTAETVIALAKSHPHLTSLNLWDCNHKHAVDTMTNSVIVALAEHCRQLSTLNVGWCKGLKEPALCQLIRNCPELKNLDLSNIEITNRSLNVLAEKCPRLESLYLKNCFKITDKAIQTLASKCPLLKQIHLGSGQITDKAIYALAENCPQLTNLELSWSRKITDGAIKRLAEKCPNLKEILLSNCNVTPGCIEELQRSYPNLRIEQDNW